MADPFSIVIICKNEAKSIETVLNTICHLTDDIVIYDTGSTDETVPLVKNFPVKIYEGQWLGFGPTKKKAVSLARYNWILSIDADEALDDKLQYELKNIEFRSESVVYNIRFRNFLGKKYLRWGEWGGDKHIRLFNRNHANWDEAPVHEQLVLPDNTRIEMLKGTIQHRTMIDMVEYSNKMVRYALLNAEKYYRQGKRSTWLKRYINPVFSFIKHYFLMLGILDGWEGFVTARMTSFYTFLKYSRLYELNKAKIK